MAQETAQATPEAPAPGPVTRILLEALPGLQYQSIQTPLDEAILIQRDDLLRVMETLRDNPRLGFDFLRCLSGVDYITEMEVAYHFYSFPQKHTLAVKVRCPYSDLHVPSVSHLWATANWHEREAKEMFGIVFDGHPDLRPLLTEEGLGYYILRKSHPLAEIEEWQEDYIRAVEEARVQMAPPGAAPEAAGEKESKVALAQKKAAIIKKVREDAQAQGLAPDAVKAAVQEALAKLEQEGTAAPTAPAPAAPAGDRAAKIQAAQQKAELIKKVREDARAKGLSPEDERKAVAEALKAFAEEQKGE